MVQGKSEKIRPIAIYLPQFHPIPENDKWWAKGFTEWANVSKAKPLFKNHYQPHIPADLGFYDLRVEEVREDQVELAKEYGIHGFCYYHYWFNGKRLLERPFQEVFTSGKPDFPFMLFWANETWSRRWLGEERDILLSQTYSEEDYYNHAAYLAEVFNDKRYIRIDGKPIFIIYRPLDIPNPSTFLQILRNASKEYKQELYIIASNSHIPLNYDEQLLDIGFDGILNFRPQLGVLPNAFFDKLSYNRLAKNFLRYGIWDGRQKIYQYQEAVELMNATFTTDLKKHLPCVFVGWDNTPRRGKKGIVIQNNKASYFKSELERLKLEMTSVENSTNLLFINAWNEWGEGNHLEPDYKNGRQYLQAVKEVFG